ncbi:isoprenylcysteine carboxyl methyltransferase family protein [Chitinophaga japonensis]|uniref:Isoprenylcysteine carboxyl methyltransferase (ICMT) family protein YpbQ n=1 Tax=Chitinophaga japonensis TaxID=104662 RepID=A0A562T6N3_CHIJA|nr:isoprenylcysteine carboxylmethyltransferase family protein [Chitinophaga japonensis]TWI88746.1 isoprenylcysteine carboxyl methyltransferase (ICMT) family protein YpbQ [Chitinophaga japonensis]
MEPVVLAVFYILVIARLLSIFISAANERRLKQLGAVEYGRCNSAFLVLAHFAYYIACVIEGNRRGAFFYDGISYLGLGIYAFSIAVLYYVIYAIRHVWTVKLIIAPPQLHVINKSPLFKYIKHPNYFLNIIPELIGIALFLHAWITLVAGLIIYLVPLITRIKQEEAVMKEHFSEY